MLDRNGKEIREGFYLDNSEPVDLYSIKIINGKPIASCFGLSYDFYGESAHGVRVVPTTDGAEQPFVVSTTLAPVSKEEMLEKSRAQLQNLENFLNGIVQP